MPKQKYIIYSSGLDDTNPLWMTVIDGLPYYRSNGALSHTPGIWYPFICIAGNQERHFDALPDYYDTSEMQYFIHQYGPQVLIKHEESYFIRGKHKRDIIQGDEHLILSDKRIATKKSLIYSARLSSSFPKDILKAAGLTPEEIALADEPFEFEEKPDFTSGNYDTLNEWLMQHGAVLATALFQNKKVQEFNEVVEVKYSQKPKKLTEAELDEAWKNSLPSEESFASSQFSFFNNNEQNVLIEKYVAMLESTDEIRHVLAMRFIEKYPKTDFAAKLQKILLEKDAPVVPITALSLTTILSPTMTLSPTLKPQ